MTVEEICKKLKKDEGIRHIGRIQKDRHGYLITETNEYGDNLLRDPFFYVDNNGVLLLTGYGAYDLLDIDSKKEIDIPQEFRPTKTRK